MKNQYFGDKRDCFKYGFLLTLMERPGGFRRLVYAPMLTPDDGTTDGGLTDYRPGDQPCRPDLWEFLRDCVERGRRDVRRLGEYMKNRRFEYVPYRDDSFFAHAGRAAYFSGVPGGALDDALVFFDPDNGFEVRSMRAGNGDKYIRYKELADVVLRMGAMSAAVVYQHFPRKDRNACLAEVGRAIRARTGIPQLFAVGDNEIALVAVPKTAALAAGLKPVLETYSREHDLTLSRC